MAVKTVDMVRNIRDRYYEETKELPIEKQIRLIKTRSEELQKKLGNPFKIKWHDYVDDCGHSQIIYVWEGQYPISEVCKFLNAYVGVNNYLIESIQDEKGNYLLLPPFCEKLERK